MRRLVVSFSAFLLAACGGTATPAPRITASQALTGTAELLEFEAPTTRQDLFREVARTSQLQASRPSAGLVLFPIIHNGDAIAAPGFDARVDLLQAPDAGEPLQLAFDRGERWSEDRRDSLQGLSEREAVELVARTLLSHWGIRPEANLATIQVERWTGAPYAAAYVNGVLRVNPSFVYLAAASVGPSSPTSLQ